MDDIVIVDRRLERSELARLVDRGANDYPGQGRDGCLEHTALINIRPAQGSRSMEVEDPAVREAVRRLTFELIGEGEAL
ncbi:MAG: hypothetical protein JXB32_23105 [Deltaproteobacteria bacterium]|nr:hypothetical protein [Deltaproteobacteria bacterium]